MLSSIALMSFGNSCCRKTNKNLRLTVLGDFRLAKVREFERDDIINCNSSNVRYLAKHPKDQVSERQHEIFDQAPQPHLQRQS